MYRHRGDVYGLWWACFLDEVGKVRFSLVKGEDTFFIGAEEVVYLRHVFDWNEKLRASRVASVVGVAPETVSCVVLG